MDFANILDQWDAIQRAPKKQPAPQSQVSHKKANAPTIEEKMIAKAKADLRKEFSKIDNADEIMKEEAARKINPMELWLRRYGTVDKDKENDDFREKTKLESREYLRTMSPEAKIDLHGLTQTEAEERLEAFVSDCKRRGLKKILIVHGKGNHSHGSDPVLGPLVRRFIEHDKRLGTSGHPDRYLGGTGATWVIIK